MASAMKAPTAQLLRAMRRSLFQHPPLCQRQITTAALAHSRTPARLLSTSVSRSNASAPSPTRSRGPKSKETTQTDFPAMDVLANMPPPTTSIDACVSDGFHLDNGVKVTEGAGVLLVAGEAFAWKPWLHLPDGKRSGMLNSKGQWEVGDDVWGVLDVMWPKPDLLILGLGASIYPIAPATRRRINEMGIQVDIQDTRNASAQFNLLATERGVSSIAAALIPIGWKGKE